MKIGWDGQCRWLYVLLALFGLMSLHQDDWTAAVICVAAAAIIEALERLLPKQTGEG